MTCRKTIGQRNPVFPENLMARKQLTEEEFKEYKRVRSAARYAAKRDEILAKAAAKYRDNAAYRAAILEQGAEWKLNNRERANEHARLSIARKRQRQRRAAR